MADKAKHAFGNLENVDSAISSGIIDAYDILFVKDAEGKPYVGWIDKNGEKVICDDTAEFEALESQIATKANVSDVAALETQLATKANSSDVTELEAEIATKVDATTVQSMIEKATVGIIEVVEF